MTPGDSIFVIGMEPGPYRISVMRGEIDSEAGVFLKNTRAAGAYYGGGTNGYVVAKAKPGDVLAITGIETRPQGSSPKTHWPCNGETTIVFQLPRDTATVYVGDITYRPGSKSPELVYTEDLSAAQAHVRANYANLGSTPEKIEHQILPVSQPCFDNVGPVIPIGI